MQRVIGLDIGSYSIKAVEIVNTFKSYEISNFYENVIPHVEELDPDIVIPACMEQLFQENNLQADRIVTAMPGQYISSRIMTFNFSDARKIETAVMAEVEDAVPFNLDDMIVDHQILGNMDGKTVALVVMTRKNFLRSFLEHLQRISIDPKLVDVDSLAFYNLSSYIEMEPGMCCGLVDVGHEKTSVCIVQDGVLRMFRSINLGGRFITEFLARDLETDFGEAQRVKHNISTVLTEERPHEELAGDDKMIAERMTLAANAIVKELGRTFYAFKNWEKAPIGKLFISGGTTRIRDFDRYLKEQLEIDVECNRLDEADLMISPDLGSHMSILPQSVAIGMRAVTSIKRHSQINLRQGEFAYVQNYESILRGSGIAFKVVAIALLILSFTYGIKHISYASHIKDLQNQYMREYTAIFPGEKKKYKPGRFAFKKLRNDAKLKLTAEVEQKRQAIDNFSDENRASPALIVLKEISREMPQDLQINVTMFQYQTSQNGEGRLLLRGETDSHATVAKIEEALQQVSILKDVAEAGDARAKPGTDNKVIEFTINGSYRPEG